MSLRTNQQTPSTIKPATDPYPCIKLTPHRLPIRLRIPHRRHRRPQRPPRHRPPRLHNPNPRARPHRIDHTLHRLHAIPKHPRRVGDGRVLKIRIPRVADEVAGADDVGVGGVDPGGPGVGVADGDVGAEVLE